MLKKISKQIDAVLGKGVHSNFNQIDDPVAKETDWRPLKRGGTSFRTHFIAESGSDRIKLVPTKMAKVFPWLFILVGVGFTSGNLLPFVVDNLPFDGGIFNVFVGLVFLGIGIYILRSLSQVKTFDKASGFYWAGKKEPRDVFDASREAGFIELRDIYALQIIKERVKSDKTHYSSYELNLILKDTSRVNVVDHSNLGALQMDASKIGEFLDIPIWKKLD